MVLKNTKWVTEGFHGEADHAVSKLNSGIRTKQAGVSVCVHVRACLLERYRDRAV